MTRFLAFAALSVTFMSLLPQLDAQTPDRATDEQAIRAAAAAYQAAFNQGDAKTLAALWVADGEYIDQTGFLMRGREVLEKAFSDFFSQNKGAKLEINIDTIKFLEKDVVSETGTTRTVTADGQPPAEGRYSVIYTNRDGKWLMLSVQERPPYPPSNYGRLKDLEFLIGDWIDEQPNGPAAPGAPVIQIKSYWSVNRNFIIREFVATVDGDVRNLGTQRIGWHAPSQQIRSWAFDSKGGIIDGSWSKNGTSWSVQSTEALPDGQIATAIETVTQNSDRSQTWAVTNRNRGGNILPDETFKLVSMRN